MAEKLTIQQAQAVADRGGKLLVSAAAGSGKTKVLVDRLMGYLTDPVNPANIDEFLIITYTKAAASELRGKIAAKLSQRIAEEPENRHLQQQLQRLYMTNISTVHSFCGDILRQYAYRLDISADFRVADENECRQIRDTVMAEVLEKAYDTAGEDADFCAFVDTQGMGRDDRQVPEILLKVYDSARCHLDPNGWLERCVTAVEAEGLTDASQTVWGRLLMDELFSCLDLQIQAVTLAAQRASERKELEKPAALLRDILYQLQQLRQSQSWDEIVSRRNIDYGRISFPRKFDDPELINGIKAVRDACKKDLERQLRCFADPSEQVLRDLDNAAGAVRGMVKLVKTFWSAYDSVKKRRRMMDFSDLEHRSLDLLLGTKRTGATAVALEIGQCFREVMVDEYQDSNEVQDAIYSALTLKNQNCFMVGDVKQSIYQFRLADPGIFLEKYASYLDADTAKPGEGRRVLLSKNFRSGGAVLAAVNHVFETCMTPEVGGLHYGDAEALHEGIPHVPLGEPEVELYGVEIREDTYREEAAFTAQRISQLLDGSHMVRDGEALRPIKPEDIVILLRSPGSVGETYQAALERIGIRCTSGGSGDLLQTREIGVLRSLLQAIQNPRQDIPLIAAMASPIFCFTADELATIRGKHKKCSFYDALLRDDSPKTIEFLELLRDLRRETRMNSLSGLLETIFVRTRMDSVFGAMDDGELKAENLRAFYELAIAYESGGQRDLGRFLEHLDAMEEKGLAGAASAKPTGCVTIMSIHKSKGLEFPVVFLCGMSRLFNKESQRAQVLCHKELGIGISAADSTRRVRYPTISKRAISARIGADSLSEEMRVLYVALTRARDRLIMTYASNNLQKELQEMTARLNMGSRELLIRDAVCPGEWVLLTALSRTEAGELFSLGGKPAQTALLEYPWLIRVVSAPEIQGFAAAKNEQVSLRGETVEQIRQGLRFAYGHTPATQAPSKQTATQKKGRVKDQEAAENTREMPQFIKTWRKPTFAEKEAQGKTYGSAVHAALQYIRFEMCVSEAEISLEVSRLVEEGFISSEQAALVDCGGIARFFDSELGKKLRTAKQVLREFKFSILDDAAAYGDGLEGERILLQGVVDCALIEPDGITVVDFKTDHVTEQTLDTVVQRYHMQVETYADALRRIYQMPIKASYLYFFRIDRFVQL